MRELDVWRFPLIAIRPIYSGIAYRSPNGLAGTVLIIGKIPAAFHPLRIGGFLNMFASFLKLFDLSIRYPELWFIF